MITILHIDAIVSDPEIRSGRPSIAGTGICVSDLVAYYVYDRQTPEELATGFKLTLGQVHAALAYYFMHKSEIDAEMQANALNAEQSIQKLKHQRKLITLE